METYEIYARPLLETNPLPLIGTMDEAQYQVLRKKVHSNWRYWLSEAFRLFYQLFYQLLVSVVRTMETFSTLVILLMAFAVIFYPEVVTQILEPGLKDLPSLLKGFSTLFITLFGFGFIFEIWVHQDRLTSGIMERYSNAVNELIALEFDVAQWRVVVQQGTKV